MPDPIDDRIHSASRMIRAAPQAVYDGLINREALARWLPPQGATGEIDIFEPRPGGRFRLTLTFAAGEGKSTSNTDTVEARFVELVSGARVVWAVQFGSNDPAFAGTMTMTWTIAPGPDGAVVTVVASDVPAGIRREDHEPALASSLANLAHFVE